MLDRNNAYSGEFELGKIPYFEEGGLNLVRIYMHLTWMPENTRRRGYWCFSADPEIMKPHGNHECLMEGMEVFDVIEQNNWKKCIKEKTLYDELSRMRPWMNNYTYRGTPGQERLLERARKNGLMVPGNEAEYLRSIHMETIMFTGIGYTREYNNEAYIYRQDLLVNEIPLAVEGVLGDIFKMPYRYRVLNNIRILG